MTGQKPEDRKEFAQSKEAECIRLRSPVDEGELAPGGEEYAGQGDDATPAETDNVAAPPPLWDANTTFASPGKYEPSTDYARLNPMAGATPPPPIPIGKRPRYPHGFTFIVLLVILSFFGNAIEGVRANFTASVLSMLGPSFPNSIEARLDSAVILDRNRSPELAQQSFERAAKDSEKHFGKSNYKTIYANLLMASALSRRYENKQADAILNEYLPMLKYATGNEPADIGDVLVLMAYEYDNANQYEMASKLYEAAAPYLKGRNNWRYVNCFINGGYNLTHLQKYNEAQKVLDQAVKAAPMLQSDERLADALKSRGRNLNELGRYDEAEKDLREGLPLSIPGTRQSTRIEMELARALSGQGKTAEATKIIKNVLENSGQKSWDHMYATVILGNIARDSHDFARAEAIYKNCIAQVRGGADGPFVYWIEEQYSKMKNMRATMPAKAGR